jgi:hypothetical protein
MKAKVNNFVQVGVYQLGFRMVRLVADFTTGNGCVQVCPDDHGLPQVVVGCDGPWDEVIGTLLHEAYELSFIDLNTRYKARPSWSEESSDFMFIMTHNQLSETCERVGSFIEHALPELSKVYHKRNKHTCRK